MTASVVAGCARAAIGPRLTRCRLGTGPTVVVNPDPALGFVVVHTWLGAGSADDPPDGSGLAHLVEHLAAAASTVRGDAAPQAATSLEHTTYADTGPPQAMPDLVARAAARLRAVHETVRGAVVDAHREVVLREIGQREDPARFGSGLRRSLPMLFGPDHPCGRPPLGIPDHLRSLGPGDVATFADRHVVAGRVVLAVVGAVDADHVLAEVERCFADLPAGGPAPQRSLPPAAGDGGRVDVEEGQPTGLLRCSYRLPRAGLLLDAAAETTTRLLAGAPFSALNAALVEAGTALGVTAVHTPGGAADAVGVLKVLAPAHVDLGDVAAAVVHEVGVLAASGPADDVLTAARATQVKRWLSALSSARGRAEQICRYEAWYGDGTALDGRLTALRSVSAADVAEVAGTWLTRPAVVAHHPAGGATASWLP